MSAKSSRSHQTGEKRSEDELAFRNKGETELQGKVEELEERLQEERELHQRRIEGST
jgi:hypothetical protein